jgi:hypothetical protein
MKNKQIYYHILEYGSYGKIGYQGYYTNLLDAQARINTLSEMFTDLDFQIFIDTSKNEPPIVTI